MRSDHGDPGVSFDSRRSRARTSSPSSGWCAACRWPTRWCATPSALARAHARGPRRPEFVKKWVEYGASVRAAQYLVLGGKARALMRGRCHVSFEDIRALAHPVLRHRILTNFHAESERVSSEPDRGPAARGRRRCPARGCEPPMPAAGSPLPRPAGARAHRQPRAAGPHRRRRASSAASTARPTSGISVDFAEHRPYMPGDDIRRIDWRLFARSDRFYVKEFEADSNANFMVLLDVSRSMQFSSPRRHEARLRPLPGGLPRLLRPQAAGPRGARDLRLGHRRLRAALGQAPRGRAARARPPRRVVAGRARAAARQDGRGLPAARDLWS